MEKDRINILLNNPSEATQDDIHLLDQESEKYPYAQALHILRAKISFLLNEAGKNEKLTRAAIYSADRSVLKKVITEKWYLEQQKHITPFQDLPKFDLNIAPEKTKKEYIIHPEEADSSSIFAEVLKNLEQLKALRQQFQFLELNEDTSEKESPKTNPEPQKSNEVKKEEPKAQKIQEPKKKELKPPDTKKEDSKKKKLDHILQEDEELDSKVNVFYLREIEQKKEPLERPASDRHIVQNEIIERFIEEQPSIGSVKKESDRAIEDANRDLAEKSTKFNDELVSENLAIIMLKQGKKERAIDIYKKLIWKLPQKKAYFAARIEEINK